MLYFLVLADYAAHALLQFWFITLPTAAAVFAVCVYTFSHDSGLISAKVICSMAALFVFPAIILVLGVQYASPTRPPPPNPDQKAGKALVKAVIICHLCAGPLLSWQLRRYIWAMLAVFVLSLEISMAASLVSGMAITGHWL